MRIHKIYIQNFKGVNGEYQIDLVENISIFDGPNGFGKTTIFDAIEFVLTGCISRSNSYEHVTDDTSRYYKPFFQNQDTEDVVLKLYVQSRDTDKVIVLFYDKEITISDKNVAGTYNIIRFFDTPENFLNKVNKDYSTAKKAIGQNEIDEFIYQCETKYSLSNLYRLFNYLQQEESTYFLEKNEKEKYNDLSFMFQTEEADFQLKQLKEFDTKLGKKIALLSFEIDQLKKLHQNFDEDAKYVQLFSKKVDFDGENIFDEMSMAKVDAEYSRFIIEIEKLIEHRGYFKPETYFLSEKHKEISKYLDDKYVHSYLLLEYLDEVRIQKYSSQIEKLERYNRFIGKPTQSDLLSLLQEFDFSPQEIAKAHKSCEAYSALLEEKSTSEKQLSEFEALRQQIISSYKEIRGISINKNTCPVCDTVFKTVEDLEVSIKKKTEALTKSIGRNSELISTVLQELHIYQENIKSKISEFKQGKSEIITHDFLLILKTTLPLKSYGESLASFLSKEGIDINRRESKTDTFDDLALESKKLKEQLASEQQKIVINTEQLKHEYMFSRYFDCDADNFYRLDLESLNQKKKYIEQKYYQMKYKYLKMLNGRKEKLDNIHKRLKNTVNEYRTSLTAYKKDILKSIQIPFYIFTGKILQNYQQGLGIFISFGSESSTGRRFRFVCGTKKDDSSHDAIHMLSSGQLSVVALSFLLSLNKIYNAEITSKFLAIDDPVQSMDDLNIHTFIELIRHEFSEYQILLSTHDDDTARYMNYKFQNFGLNSSRVNVQELLYPTKDN